VARVPGRERKVEPTAGTRDQRVLHTDAVARALQPRVDLPGEHGRGTVERQGATSEHRFDLTSPAEELRTRSQLERRHRGEPKHARAQRSLDEVGARPGPT